jgi:hypothetical protein
MLVFTNLPANEGDNGLRLYLYSPSSGSLINPGGSLLTEVSNGVFMTEVTQSITEDLRADVYEGVGGGVIASDWLYIGNSVVGLRASEEPETTVYYNVVRRNSDDNQPLYFEWPNDTATVLGQVSINGGVYVECAGSVVYHRTEFGAYLYRINYNSADRPLEGTAEYKLSDGTTERVVPMTIDSSNLDTGQFALTVSAEDMDGHALQGAQVYVAGTTIKGYTGTNGDITIALDNGTYEISMMPPAGYAVPESQTVVIDSAAPAPMQFTLSTGCGGVPWIN